MTVSPQAYDAFARSPRTPQRASARTRSRTASLVDALLVATMLGMILVAYLAADGLRTEPSSVAAEASAAPTLELTTAGKRAGD